MHKGQRFAWILASILFFSPALWAQTREPNAVGCALCGSLIFIPIGVIVLNIALLVWVARDAKSRGMDSAVIWMLLVMFTSVIGLIIYVLSRPEGNLIHCSSCNNQRLQASAKCPHCGNA
jgi:hypothetical protein